MSRAKGRLGTVLKLSFINSPEFVMHILNCSGHVPYLDSKLTRILQPALGGNANTAIICNITLAQVVTLA